MKKSTAAHSRLLLYGLLKWSVKAALVTTSIFRLNRRTTTSPQRVAGRRVRLSFSDYTLGDWFWMGRYRTLEHYLDHYDLIEVDEKDRVNGAYASVICR
jgi:hypothetical protein